MLSVCIRNGYFEANQVVVRKSPHDALAQLHRERQAHRLGQLQRPQSSLFVMRVFVKEIGMVA